jgi:hypothetical protein
VGNESCGEMLEMGGLYRQWTRVLDIDQWLRFVQTNTKPIQRLWFEPHMDQNPWLRINLGEFW